MDDAGRGPADIPPPSKDRRWDIDEQGHGVGEATEEARRIRALADHAASDRWVAEQPDAHLWPHLDRAIAAPDSPWRRATHQIDDAGRLVVDVVHSPTDGASARAILRADVMRLLGIVLESATFIEIDEPGDGQLLVVDVVTGDLDDQTAFRTHGHTLRIRVVTG